MSPTLKALSSLAATALLVACGGAEAVHGGRDAGFAAKGGAGGSLPIASGGSPGGAGGAAGAGGASGHDAGAETPASDGGQGGSGSPADGGGKADAAGDAAPPLTCAGGALLFDGVDDQASMLREVQDDFTLEAWIRSSSPSPTGTSFWHGDALIYADVRGTTNDFGTAVLNNKFAFGVGTTAGTTITSTSDVNTGAWVHVAAIRERAAGRISVMVDGVVEAVATPGVRVSLGAQPRITLGANLIDGHYFAGSMDEVRIWNVARTSASIRGTMHQRLTGSEPGLVGYWRFDDSAAATTPDSSRAQNPITLGNGDPAAAPERVASEAPICP